MKEIIAPYEQLLAAGFPREHIVKQVRDHIAAIDTLLEVAPPGWEDWIEHRKEDHPGRNPGIWYAIAWRNYNRGETYRGPKEEDKSGRIVKRPGPKPKPKPKPKPDKKKTKKKTKKTAKRPVQRKPRKRKVVTESLSNLKRMWEAACACNSASGGGIAGLDNDPPVRRKKKPPMFRRGM